MTKKFPIQHYETVIFDLGQVIVDLDGKAVISKLQQVSSRHDVDYKELIVSSPLLQQYETGKIDGPSFRDGLMELLNIELTYEEFDNIWNAMLAEIPLARLELMERLGADFQTMILSNTNAIHERRFDRMVGEKAQGRKMKDFVRHAYYSHDIGFRKPDRKIYEFIIDRHDLDPERTLFLDDRLDNVESAREVGIDAVQVKHPDQIFEILK